MVKDRNYGMETIRNLSSSVILQAISDLDNPDNQIRLDAFEFLSSEPDVEFWLEKSFPVEVSYQKFISELEYCIKSKTLHRMINRYARITGSTDKRKN